MHLTVFDAAAMLIVLTALFAYLNLRFVKLPRSVGLTIMGALGAFAVIGLDRLLPESRLGEEVIGFIAGIDFHRTLMEGMLSFLLLPGGFTSRGAISGGRGGRCWGSAPSGSCFPPASSAGASMRWPSWWAFRSR